jgi:hypothetical protein
VTDSVIKREDRSSGPLIATNVLDQGWENVLLNGSFRGAFFPVDFFFKLTYGFKFP